MAGSKHLARCGQLGVTIVPYRIERLSGGGYRVVNAVTGRVHARRTSKAKAKAQVRVMEQAEGKHGKR